MHIIYPSFFLVPLILSSGPYLTLTHFSDIQKNKPTHKQKIKSDEKINISKF